MRFASCQDRLNQRGHACAPGGQLACPHHKGVDSRYAVRQFPTLHMRLRPDALRLPNNLFKNSPEARTPEPLPPDRQVAGARARRRTGGAALGGRGAAKPHAEERPRRGRDAGEPTRSAAGHSPGGYQCAPPLGGLFMVFWAFFAREGVASAPEVVPMVDVALPLPLAVGLQGPF